MRLAIAIAVILASLSVAQAGVWDEEQCKSSVPPTATIDDLKERIAACNRYYDDQRRAAQEQRQMDQIDRAYDEQGAAQLQRELDRLESQNLGQ